MNTQSKEYSNDLTLTHYVSLTEQQSTQYEFIANSNVNTPSLNIDFSSYSTKIEKLSTVSIDKIPDVAKKMLDNMLEYSYNQEIFKRYSVHIISTIFDRTKDENIQCKKLIDTNYYSIYQKTTLSLSNENAAEIINKSIMRLCNDFQLLSAKNEKSSTIQKVISIIVKNYQNPELSISMIAEKLGMNASFISREFKNKTATSHLNTFMIYCN